MKQCKEECKIVMRKLARIANVVINVGKSCERYNLSEREIPDGLRTILNSLQRFVHHEPMSQKTYVVLGRTQVQKCRVPR